MPSTPSAYRTAALRNLPSIDELSRFDDLSQIKQRAGEKQLNKMLRAAVSNLREAIIAGARLGDTTKEGALRAAAEIVKTSWDREQTAGVRRVINATGVVLHTNLGRAPLSHAARLAIAEEAAGYCTLEYSPETGTRAARGVNVESLLVELTGAQDAIVVNNCAAAAFFVLSAFASGGEVVVSRGELVEIGGDFRVPDVLRQSGAALHEVGTTNRTTLSDYEQAISKTTRMLLRVHPSNYRIVGFTATPTLKELTGLALARGVLIYENLGSGALTELAGEPTVAMSLAAGVDLVSFSGDKLLGGPQAGIIAGRKELIATLRKHPLYRVLRTDKLTTSALETTLLSYQAGRAAVEVPVVSYLLQTAEELNVRALEFSRRFAERAGGGIELQLEIIDGYSAVGGGAAPTARLPSRLISVNHPRLSDSKIEEQLRGYEIPVITRIENNLVLIDLRTVAVDEVDAVIAALLSLAA